MNTNLCGSCLQHSTEATRLGVLTAFRSGDLSNINLASLGYGSRTCPICHLPCLWNPSDWTPAAYDSAISRLQTRMSAKPAPPTPPIVGSVVTELLRAKNYERSH
jgi:hypothetical protein